MILVSDITNNKEKNTFFSLLLVYYLLFNCSVSTAQIQKNKNGLNKSLYNSSLPSLASSFNLTLITGLTQKAIIEREEGFYNIKSSTQPYFEGGVDYEHAFYKNNSYSVGLHVTAIGRNAIFHVPVEKINPIYKEPRPSDKFSAFDFGLVIPLLLQRQWNLSIRKAIYAQVGIQLHYSLESDIGYGDQYMDTSGNNIDVFDLNLNTNNQNKLWFTYTLGSGYQWVLKNNNLLKIGIVLNLSFTHFVQGNYQVNIPGDPFTQGTYHVNGSYLGIAISYGFTGLNRKIVRRYEKQKE